MSEQKAAMDEQRAVMNEQNAATERLEGEVVSRLDLLAGQWNNKIWKVTEQQRTSNKSFSQHFDGVEARLKLLESGAAKPPHSAPPTIYQSKGESAFASLAPGGSQGDPISVAEIQGCRNCLVFQIRRSSQTS